MISTSSGQETGEGEYRDNEDQAQWREVGPVQPHQNRWLVRDGLGTGFYISVGSEISRLLRLASVGRLNPQSG